MADREKILVKIKENPDYIKEVKVLDDNLIIFALNHGLKPTKDIFLQRPEFINYTFLLKAAYEEDSSVIAIFPAELLRQMTEFDIEICDYIFTEEDLIKNNDLRNNYLIMKKVISDNPALAKYIGKTSFYDLVVNVIANGFYPTEEDLKKFPVLRYFDVIFEYLNTINPKLKKYYVFLEDKEKVEFIVSEMLDSGIEGVLELPFLSDNEEYELPIEDLRKILVLLHDTNINISMVRKDNVGIVDKIIDGLVNIQYEAAKYNRKLLSINQLADEIERNFRHNDFSVAKISILVDQLYFWVNGFKEENAKSEFISKNQLTNKIISLYFTFVTKGSLDFSDTTKFYNMILNLQANRFKSQLKGKLINQIKASSNISQKKQRSIINGEKLNGIMQLIKGEKYKDTTNIENDMLEKLADLRIKIPLNKTVKKSGLVITDYNFEALEQQFLNCEMDNKTIESIFSNIDSAVVSVIKNAYIKIYLNYADLFEFKCGKDFLDDKKKSLFWNEANFEFFNLQRYYRNIAEMILEINKTQCEEILNQGKDIFEILALIDYANIFEDFKTSDLINILRFYSKIKNRMKIDLKLDNLDLELILKNFNLLIKLATGYAESDNLYTVLLGKNVVKNFGIPEIKPLAETYLQAFKRDRGFIPRVEGEIFGTLTYASGEYNDTNRLMMGRKIITVSERGEPIASCLDLFTAAGKDAYLQVLHDENADIVMIKEKYTNNFFARMLMFRRGNVVFLAPPRCINPLDDKYISKIHFLHNVANQIIQKAIAAGDNIDFVVTTSKETTNYSYVLSSEEMDLLPHANLERNITIIAAKDDNLIDKPDFSRIDLYAEPKASYMEEDNKLFSNEEISEESISRLYAFEVLSQENEDERKILESNHEPFVKSNYISFFAGKYWYIGIKEDGTVDEYILPAKFHVSENAFSTIKNNIQGAYLNPGTLDANMSQCSKSEDGTKLFVPKKI